jgi:hypothetical protein
MVWQLGTALCCVYSKTASLRWCDSWKLLWLCICSGVLCLLKNHIVCTQKRAFLRWCDSWDSIYCVYSKRWCDSIMTVFYCLLWAGSTQKRVFELVWQYYRSLLLKNCIFELVWQYYDGLFYSKTAFLSWSLWRWTYSKTAFLSWCDRIMTVSSTQKPRFWVGVTVWKYCGGVLCVLKNRVVEMVWQMGHYYSGVLCTQKPRFLRWCDSWDCITVVYCVYSKTVYSKTAYLRWCDIMVVSCVRCVTGLEQCFWVRPKIMADKHGGT